MALVLALLVPWTSRCSVNNCTGVSGNGLSAVSSGPGFE